MTQPWLVLALLVGCGKDGDKDSEDAEGAPASCVVDDEVCMSFDSGWSSGDAAAECADFDGQAGACPGDAIGECSVDSGVTYLLYGLNPVDSAAYCDYLGGEWSPADG